MKTKTPSMILFYYFFLFNNFTLAKDKIWSTIPVHFYKNFVVSYIYIFASMEGLEVIDCLLLSTVAMTAHRIYQVFKNCLFFSVVHHYGY